MPKEKEDKLKWKDRPDKGRPGVDGLGPYCSIEISPAKPSKRSKDYPCAICAGAIEPGMKRFAVTMFVQPWVTDENVLMTAGEYATVGSLCSPNCRDAVVELVGDGKTKSIRDFAQHCVKQASELGVAKEWEFDYLKTQELVKFESSSVAVEKALRLVAKDGNIPASHKDRYFDHHGKSKRDRINMKHGRYDFSWDKKKALWKRDDIPALAADDDFRTLFLQELARR